MFNKRIVTKIANQLERDAETTKRNRKQAESTYIDYKNTTK